MRLELGSGDRPTPGFVHLDARPDAPDVDIVGDARNLGSDWLDHAHIDARKPTLGNVEEIRATHLLEHFSHLETIDILKHWRSYLQPGGKLYLEVPNLAGHVEAWRAGRSTDAEFVVYLFGGQEYEGNTHRTMFTEATLRAALKAAGFVWIDVRDVGLVLCANARA